MTRWLLTLSLFVLCVPALPAEASKELDVEAALKRSIIPAELPESEVQRYTETRVPPMPEVTSVAEWERYAAEMRRTTLERVVFRGKAAEWRTATAGVEWLETIDGGEGYRIRKLRYEALPGLWVPALLYEPDRLQGKVPVVLNVNGHDRANGKAADYKQIRCINQAKRGMLALNVEWLGMGQLNTPGFDHYRMNQLDLCGTSGLAPFYLSMSRGLDVLLSLDHADPDRVAVAGLSGGGWQTIFISSLDDRVVLSNPVAGYSSFRTRARHLSDLGDSEQTPCDLATVTDYAQLTALRAPRPTLLTFNAQDNCCFQAGHALPPLMDAARPIYELHGKSDHLRAHVNYDPGTHNFDRDNREAFYRMLGDFFYADEDSFDWHEIACSDEVKTKQELHVAVPGDNADFHSLASALMRDLPSGPDAPDDPRSLPKWRQDRRKVLKKTVRAKDYPVQVLTEVRAKLDLDGGIATFFKLALGQEWTVPVVEVVRGDPRETVIVLADGGRQSVAGEIERLMKAGKRVLAVDPFYFGESTIAHRDFLYALLVAAVGERPLGIQAGQVAAIAGWAGERYEGGSLSVVAHGPRTSLVALVAGALEPDNFDRMRLHGAFGSLKQIIEENKTVREAPELFCFGLLKEFDIPQLIDLAGEERISSSTDDE